MPTAEPTRNRLLAALPQRERERLLACFRPVRLALAEVLNGSGGPVRHAYFPLEGCISLSTQAGGDAALDVGLIGNEGMLGIGLVLGVESCAQVAVVQGAGLALRADSASFRHALRACPALARTLKRYVHVLMDQLTQNATCSRFHVIEARLARLLLMTQDRANVKKPMHLTHEALAGRLGVRRAGISIAASALQGHALIAYRRGEVTILDRNALKRAACNCYGTDNDIYARIMGDRPDRAGRRLANPRRPPVD